MDIATIGFEADTRGLERAERHLDAIPPKSNAAATAASRWGSVAVISGRQIASSMQGAAASIGAVSTASSALTGSLGALSATLSGGVLVAVGALVAGVAAAVGSLGLFITNTIEADKVTAQLEAVLKSTGGVSGQTAESINKMAAELQSLTTFEDDAIASAQALLLTFTKIRGEAFRPATEAVLNLATAMQGDLRGATIMVGKALQDPVRGMSAMSRAGVTFTEGQKAMAKQMVATGDIAGAQRLILKELETQFGGSAKAARDTLGGALINLKNVIGNLFELGGDQTNPLTKAINGLAEAVSAPEFKEFVSVVGGSLVWALGLVVQGVMRFVQGINALIGFLKSIYEWVSNRLITAFENLDRIFQHVFGVSIVEAMKNGINLLVGEFVAGWIEIEFVVKNLPSLIGSAMVAAANAVAVGAVKMVNALAKPLNVVNDALNKHVRPADKQKPGFTIIDPATVPQMGDPFAAARNAPGGPREAADIEKEIARNKKWADSLGRAAEEAKNKVKAVGGAVRDTSDALDESGSKAEDAFKKIVMGAEQAIAKLQMESQTLGMTVGEIARLTTEQELLNKAQEAGIKLTETQTARLKDLAKQTGDATNANEAAKGVFGATKDAEKFIQEQRRAQDALGMTAEEAARLRYETELLNKATKDGTVIIGDEQTAALKRAAAEMAAMESQTKRMTDSLQFVKDIFSDLFSDLKDALIGGKDLWEAFGDAALGVLAKIADKVFSMMIDEGFKAFMNPSGGSASSSGGVTSSMGGGFLSKIGDWFGGIFGGGGGGIPTPASQGISVGGIGGYSGPLNTGGGGGFSMANGMGGFMPYVGGAMGIIGGGMSLLGGKNRSTMGTIGGVGQMAGGALMMIPTGYTQIAGAIMMAVSSILGGMGQEPPTITNQEYGQLSYGGGGFMTSGGAWGPDANAKNLEGPLAKMGQTMDSVFKAFGGVKDAGKVWGVAMQSFSQQKGDWSFQNATSFLVDPSGNRRQWGMGSSESDIGMEQAGVAATLASILGGAVGPITENMRKALGTVNQSGKDTFDVLGSVVGEIMAFDEQLKKLGKTTTESDRAIEAIDDSFREMYATVEKFGLDRTQVDKFRDAARLQLSKDFVSTIDRAFMDPMTLALTEIGDERTNLLRNNSALMAIQGHVDQAARIEELYLKKRNEIIKQFNDEAIRQLEQTLSAQKSLLVSMNEYIKMLLPGGAMAGEGLQAQLEGLTGTRDAALARAMASPLDEAKVNEYVRAQAELLEFQKSYFGGDVRYQDARMRALEDARIIQDAISRGLQATEDQKVAKGGSVDPEVADLLATQRELVDQINTLLQSQRDLNAKLARRAAQGG